MKQFLPVAWALVLGMLPATAWREWSHFGHGTSKWKRNWVPTSEQNRSYYNGPGGRYGHTMVMHDTQIVLFGGRADEIQKTHIPKTYKVEDRNGTIDFASYWERVYDCDYLLRKARFTDPKATIETINCNETLKQQAVVDTTFLWNDVWMYDLNCSRSWQEDCQNETQHWQVLHEGAIDGGCKNYVEGRSGTREICTVPSERYFHGAARFNDSTMLIYGGFSHRCEEYCDDMWSFDLRYGRYIWTEIYPLDHFSKGSGPGKRWKFSVVTDGLSMAIFGGMTLWEGFLPDGATTTTTTSAASPSSLSSSNNGTASSSSSSSSSSSLSTATNTKYSGGFLSDFWVFRKRPLTRGWGGTGPEMRDIPTHNGNNDFAFGAGSDPENYYQTWEENPVDSGDFGLWESVNSTEECLADPSQASWEERFDQYCRVFWPPERAGHVAVLDTTRNRMWLHGGFKTHYPYQSTVDLDQRKQSSKSQVPFGTYNYYLDDLWYYSFNNEASGSSGHQLDAYGGHLFAAGGRWTQVRPLSAEKPSGRMEHTMLLSENALLTSLRGHVPEETMTFTPKKDFREGWEKQSDGFAHGILILQGGFGVNHHMNDTWMFNITTSKWLHKHKFERARYPANCTADVDLFEDSTSGCFELRWPRDRQRDAYYPFEPIDDRRQRWYSPDFQSYGLNKNRTNAYYGILDRGEHVKVGRLLANGTYGAPGRFGATAEDGTPLVPYAKTGPRQWVRNVSLEEAALLGLPVNYTRPWDLNVTVYERCTSVYGEPTRNTQLDGRAGRHIESVMVAQPRRQRPGWDGCRDRHDNRTDLPHHLQWDHPPQRSGHAAVYNDDYGVMMVYGGRGPAREEPPRDSTTFGFTVKHDFWQFSIHNCINNCSNHGFCSYGFCTCEDGYYGYDCSNTSCPGDYCYYDEYTHEQVCQHCCSAGYNHTDSDVYVDNADSHKVPCSKNTPGYSHGICDGYGTCQCAPPFLGDDCSSKDCLFDCSFNGYCSVEYPVSRCVCNPTYFGEFCQHVECLNNCSYPNGVCNYTEGECYCNHLYNPYENDKRWATSWLNWAGHEDGGVKWAGEDCSYITAYAAASQSRGGSGASIAFAAAAAAAAALALALSTAGGDDGGGRAYAKRDPRNPQRDHCRSDPCGELPPEIRALEKPQQRSEGEGGLDGRRKHTG